MPTDVRDALREAAYTPRTEVDLDAARRRGQVLRRRRLAGRSAAACALLAVVAGTVSVIVADRADRTPSVRAVPPARDWRARQDEAGGLSVRVPRGWTRDKTSLDSLYNGLLLSVHTRDTVRPEGSPCTPYPSVSAWLTEKRGGSDAGPRPERFGPDSGSFLKPPNDAQCVPGVTQLIGFSDAGRYFVASITFDSRASDAHRRQAYDVLNSLRFVPADRYQAPRIVTVAIHNNSGAASAGVIADRTLSAKGYLVQGFGESGELENLNVADVRVRAVVVCRSGSSVADRIARTLGAYATVRADYPTSPPADTEQTECYVDLGRAPDGHAVLDWWKTYRDKAGGFSVKIPPGWERVHKKAADVGSGELVELRSHPPFRLPEQDPCGVIQGIRALQVTIVLSEARSQTMWAPRPQAFGPDSGPLTTAMSPDCRRAMARRQAIHFSDRGRSFDVAITFGPYIATTREIETYDILDTLRFVPAGRYHPST